MSSRFGLYIVVFGLIISNSIRHSVAQGQEGDPPKITEASRGRNENITNTNRFSIPVTIFEDIATTKFTQAREGEREKREKEGLIAEKISAEAGARSAKYAWWQVIWGGLQTFLVLIGTYAIVKTLTETRRAVAAANKSVAVTEELGQAQVRAYVQFDFTNVLLSQRISAAEPSITVGGVIEIIGGSPTRKLRAGLWVGGAACDSEIIPPGVRMDTFRSYAAPSTKLEGFSVKALCKQFSFAIWESNEVWCCIFVEWVDVFKKRQKAEFQFVFISSDESRARLNGKQFEFLCERGGVAAVSA